MALPPPKSKLRKPAPVQVNPTTVSSEVAGSTCSICATALFSGETMILCPHCKLSFHEECWKEIGGCGTYGCLAAPNLPKSHDAAPDSYQPGWTAEKICPQCGKKINANALKCHFCRAIFPTEKPMTPEEYQDREYEGEEAVRMRNNLIGVFFFSAMGCLFFAMIPFNLINLLGLQGKMFEIKKLPPVLKVLFYASFGISCLWGVIFLLFLLFSI